MLVVQFTLNWKNIISFSFAKIDDESELKGFYTKWQVEGHPLKIQEMD